MGSVSKLFLFVFIHILFLNSFDNGRLASGTTVFFPSNVSNSQPQKTGCILILPSNHKFAPAVTDQKTREQLLPIQDRATGLHFEIEQGREIKISCGRGNPLTNHRSYLILSCVRGTEFLNIEDEDDEQILLPEGVECSNPRKPTPIVYRNGTCSGKGTNFDVRFVTESPPRKFYSACVDEKTSGALYSSSYIDGESFANGLVESSGSRPGFRGEEFYPFSIRQAYKWENTYEHLSELIGSDLVDDYFPTEQFRFSRGHLFPNGDGVKRFEKHATFYYMNTVPQWQILNGGNWAIIEQDVRNYAKSLSRTLQVVTGSFGVTTLKDGNNNDVELYLARDDDTGKLRLPVPRLVWKIVHDPADNAAVAIVQINNPWIKVQNDQRHRDIVCNDVCSSLPWIRSSDLLTERKGYTYCCDVKELSRTISYIPQIKYDKLLGAQYSNNDDYNYDNESESDSDSSEEEEDELDDSSSDTSSDSRSTEFYQNRDKLLVHNLTALFASIRLGIGN